MFNTAQKMKFSIKDLLSKCEQTRRKLNRKILPNSQENTCGRVWYLSQNICICNIGFPFYGSYRSKMFYCSPQICHVIACFWEVLKYIVLNYIVVLGKPPSRKSPPGKLPPIKLPPGKVPPENYHPENSHLEYSHPFH